MFVVLFSGEQARTKEDISKQRQITSEVSVLSFGRCYSFLIFSIIFILPLQHKAKVSSR